MRRERWLLATVVCVAGAAATTLTVRAAAGNDHGAPSSARLPVGPVAPVELAAPAAVGGHLPWNQPLRLEARNGRLDEVRVIDGSGAALSGGPTPDRSSWQSASALVPLQSYTVDATLVDGARHHEHRTLTLQTLDTDKHLTATISPGDNNTIGVGTPIVVNLNHPVAPAARAAVEDRLAVTTTPAVQGAWRWISATQLHWRPAAYWAPGTQVAVVSDLSRLDAGGGLWGTGRHTSSFKIGDAHVSTADVVTHRMTVTANGQVVRVMPISAGRDAYPTRGGVHIALEKAQVVTMDSQTVGIPRDSPDGYFEKVYWDVRISNGGAFVHAAPWSVGAQGHRNVSHGCINLSPADAQWFYGFSNRGDIVNVVNASAPPDTADPGMADWNIPWERWFGESVAGQRAQAEAAAAAAAPPASARQAHLS